ncbi:MAG: S41 family peptidase [Candidatus Omnitrophica bacterium]|nr:S41 family peptidase [Candidatus Omnitrophota bacterium]MBL7210729.1 S41 family peptidase [Candidatus Omnitrophota bacterium]
MRKRVVVIPLLFIIGLGVLVFVSCAISGVDRKKGEDLYRQVELFSDSLAIVRTDYVDETNAKDLIYGALKGMLASLDPHSQFMDPETYNELKVDTEGKFGGLGIEITLKDGLLTVVTPLEDTPAWRAGMKANDRIVKIDEELTRDMTLTDAVKKLRGKPGTSVNLSVLRESENKIIDFKVVRDVIKIKDIKEARILEQGIAYIRLSEFRENTPKDLDKALKGLANSGMRALVFDLRNNPGGLLDVAVKVAGKFVEKGKKVVYTKGRQPSQNMEFFADTDNPLLELPMVVLINEGSASGSEIVAACLQDYKRAIVVGMKSFGKGSVQSVIPLNDGSAIRLTTSRYFTPSDKVIHEKGVEPDITVEEGKIEITQSEKPKDQKEDVFRQIDKNKEIPGKKDPLDYKSDNQLMRAVDILKALEFYQKNGKP